MNRMRCLTLVGLAVLLAAGALAGSAAWLHSRLALGPVTAADLPVAITSPAPGSKVQLGSPVLVRAIAGTGVELASLELWAGDEMIDATWPAGPPSGWQPIGVFSWIPTEAGPTLLIARARQPDGQTHNSSPVAVTVVEGPVALTEPDAPSTGPNQAMTSSGSGRPPTGGFGPPAPAPFSPDQPPSPPPDDAQPARDWSPGLGNFATRLASWFGPAQGGPHLEASLDGCQVEVLVQHDDAGGFGIALERITTGQSFEVDLLATIDIPPGESWVSYLDPEPPPGPNQYQALLLTPEGKFGSNLVTVDVPAIGCPQQVVATPLTFLQLLHPETGPAADRAYCYLGQGEAGYRRWPAVGFLEPVDDGYGVAGQVAKLAFAPEDLAQGEVHVECWGWSGDELHLMGEYHGAGDTLAEGIGGGFGAWDGVSLQVDTDLFHSDDLVHIDESAWFAARMPYIYAELTFDPNVCGNHLPADAQNALGKVLFCTPYPMYDVGEQPYLVWTILDTCPLGIDCLTAPELEAIAADNNAKVGIGVYSGSNGMVPFEKRPLDFSLYVVWPPNPEFYCGIQRSFSVRMYYEGMPYGEGQPWQTVHGPPSNIVSIPFDCPPPEGVLVEVRFNRIDFANIDDNDNGPEVLEVYGAVFAGTGGLTDLGKFLLISEWGAPYGDCSGDYDNWSSTHEALCPQVIGQSYNSTLGYNFPWPMCRSGSLSCPGFGWYDGHKTLEVYVEDGDALRVGIMMYDYDALSANDEVCNVVVWTPHLSSGEWASHENAQWWMYHGDNGNASCEVYWTTTAKEVYY